MRFKVGDKVRVREDLQIREYYGENHLHVNPYMEDFIGKEAIIERVYGDRYTLLGDERSWEWNDDMLEPIEDPLVTKIEERNNKPVKMISDENLLNEDDPIKPAHYRKGEIDLYESWYRTYPFNEFRAIMSAIAERYMKRDKHNRVEDINKSIETLTRLKEYEVKENDKN